jgi:hypothetical protein
VRVRPTFLTGSILSLTDIGGSCAQLDTSCAYDAPSVQHAPNLNVAQISDCECIRENNKRSRTERLMPRKSGRFGDTKADDYVKPIFQRRQDEELQKSRAKPLQKAVENRTVQVEGSDSRDSRSKRQTGNRGNQRKRPREGTLKVANQKLAKSNTGQVSASSSLVQSGSSEPKERDPIFTTAGTEKLHECAPGEECRGSIVFLVLCVRHYIRDQAYWFTVNGTKDEIPEMDADAYDITVCNPVEQTKTRFCLHPHLNSIVQSGDLDRGSILEIRKWSVRFNELRGLYPPRVIVVYDCLVLRRPHEDFWIDVPLTCAWTTSSTPLETAANVPLASSRKSYLGPGAFDALPVDSRLRDPSNVERVEDPASIKSVTSAAVRIARALMGDVKRPIIGRVLRKTSLMPWPKKSDMRQSVPFKFEFEIGDGADSATVVVWNSLCSKYFYHIQLGDILIIENYRVRRGEIHLNASSPQGIIRKLSDNYEELLDFGPIAKLGGGRTGELYHPCILTSALDAWDDRSYFSLACIVTHVSPLYRERGTYRSAERTSAPQILSASDDYYIFRKYRIILARDGSEARDVCIRLYETSQRDAFDAICVPGAAILLTSLEKRELYNAPFDGVSIMEVHSTRWTSMYLLDGVREQQKRTEGTSLPENIPKVILQDRLVRRILALARWIQSSEGKKSVKIRQTFALGRIQHSTFRYTDTLEQLAALYGGQEKIENLCIEFERLRAVQSEIFLRERREVLVYGYLSCFRSTSKPEKAQLEEAKALGLAGSSFATVYFDEIHIGHLRALNDNNSWIPVVITPGRTVFGSGIAKTYNKRTAFLGRFGASLRGSLREKGLAAIRNKPMACLLALYRAAPGCDFALLEVAYEFP